MIQKTPIFVDFDRRREVVFDLNTEILIRSAGGKDSSIWETIGTRPCADGTEERILDVNLENLRLYFWAAAYADAKRVGELLTVEDVGALFKERRWINEAVVAISQALNQYYGDSRKGEAAAPAA